MGLKKNFLDVLTDGEKQKRDNWWLTRWMLKIIPFSLKPNYLTALRIVLVAFSYALWQIQQDITSLQLLVLGAAALTDWLDGSMARTRNQITALGTVFDPIADDILGVWVIVLLILKGMLNFWIGAGLIFFEAVLTIGGGILLLVKRRSGEKFSETILSNIQVSVISRYRFGLMLLGFALLILASAKDGAIMFSYFNYAYLPLILIGIALLVLCFVDNKGRLINVGKFITGLAIIIASLHLIEPFLIQIGQWLVALSLIASLLEIAGYLKNQYDSRYE